jgi:hypothetical protein
MRHGVVVMVVEGGELEAELESTMIGSELNVMDERGSSFLSQALSRTNNIICQTTHFLPQD